MVEREYSEINGERLREIRMSRGLTARRLEEHSGVSYERINELELGGGVADDGTFDMLAEAWTSSPPSSSQTTLNKPIPRSGTVDTPGGVGCFTRYYREVAACAAGSVLSR